MGASMKESELDEYIDKAYYQLKDGYYETKVSDSEFKCPFCIEKRGWRYSYDDLLYHAKGRTSSSRSSDLKEQGRHIALVSYLKKYQSPESSSRRPESSSQGPAHSSKLVPIKEELHEPQNVSDVKMEDKNHVSTKDGDPAGRKIQEARNGHEKFVFPWKGVVQNFPRQYKDGRYIGKSGSELRAELTEKGFNPTKVEPLWTRGGHSGICIVHFTGDWPGFRNAMMFEKAYESDHCGKKDWQRIRGHPGQKMFGWVAREEDYNSRTIIGKSLSKFDLKSTDDIEIEDKRKTNSLVTRLNQSIEEKEMECVIMQSKLQATTLSINQLLREEDDMIKHFNEERQKMLEDQHVYIGRIEGERDRIKNQIDDQTKKLQWLDERKARNEHEKRQIASQRKKNENALMEQKKAEETMMKLAEEQRKQKEELHRKIIDLEKELDHKQALELELERLRGAKKVVEHMREEGANVEDGTNVEDSANMEEKLKWLKEEIAEKEEELEDVESLKQTLIIKEQKASEEIKEARQAMIDGLKSTLSNKGAKPTIGVKNMGTLDNKPFQLVVKRECQNVKDVQLISGQLWAEWEAHLKDSNWKPFKIILENGEEKEVVDEDDKRLKGLKSENRDEIYQAVVTALSEVIEYKLEDRVPVLELWHNKLNRRAQLKEGLAFLVRQWALRKSRKKY